MSQNLNDIVNDYIKRKVDVYIVRTDEAWKQGNYHYAVVVKENPGFWLNAFTTEEKAIKFCEKNKLKIIS